MSTFLEVSLTEDQLADLDDHVKFENMKKNSMANPCGKEGFFRKGIVGDWRNWFSAEQAEETEKWIRESVRGTQLENAL